jgi:hypothetical protein
MIDYEHMLNQQRFKTCRTIITLGTAMLRYLFMVRLGIDWMVLGTVTADWVIIENRRGFDWVQSS